MDFNLTEQEESFKKAIRDFAQKEMKPLVDAAEVNEEFPIELFRKAGDLGYLCVSHPKEYGALGLSKICEGISIEEMARISVGLTSALMVQGGIATSLICEYGSKEQKQEYLIPAIKGKKIGGYGLTERDAGSDPSMMKTTATEDGHYYVLNGSKMFTTNGPIADFITTTAWTDKDKGFKGGMSIFLVDSNTPGFSVKKLNKMCIRSSPTGEEFFENCVISKHNLLGEEGKGWDYALKALDNGRMLHAFTSIGLAQAAYERARDYALERIQYGQVIVKFQEIGSKLANMLVHTEAARALAYKVAWKYDQKQEEPADAAMSKLFASEVATKVTSEAMQIFGGYGLLADSIIERLFRDSRRSPITEGTSEIQRMIIARAIRRKA